MSGAEGNDQSTLDIAYSQRDRRMIELLTTKGGQVGWYAKTAHAREACGYYGAAEFQDFVAFPSD